MWIIPTLRWQYQGSGDLIYMFLKNACCVVIVALFFLLLPGLFRDHLSLSHPVTSTFSAIFLHVVWTNDKNFWGVFLVYFQIALLSHFSC